jgi:glutamyl-tRNA synthetase
VESGNAYYAFDTPEELDVMRERLTAAKVPNPQYNSITRATMKNSLTLPEDEWKTKLANGDPYVIRLKVPRKEEVRFHDEVRGWVLVHSSAIDDKVLMKSDGMPTYHLANVVDDHLMEISHVIRGEEWLPSAPLHVLLYRFFGWENTMPKFAHLPLLLKPDGNGKLSKRDADLQGFPVFPLEWTSPETGEKSRGFKEDGYMPEALVNFLAFLGWNPGTTQEIFSMQELIDAFTLEKIGKAGAKFDIQKAKWFNQHYLRATPDKELGKYLLSDLKKIGIETSLEKAEKISSLLKERIVFANELVKEAQYFFNAPERYDEQVIASKWNADVATAIGLFKDTLSKISDFTSETIKHELHTIAESNGIKFGKVMQPFRVVITGVGTGPDLMHIIEILGKEESVKRIDTALVSLEQKVS